MSQRLGSRIVKSKKVHSSWGFTFVFLQVAKIKNTYSRIMKKAFSPLYNVGD